MKKPKTKADADSDHMEESFSEAASDSPGLPQTGPDSTPETPDSATDEMLQELKVQAEKAREHWDQLLRTTAEFDNFRKRAAREKEEAVRYANHKLLERLLPVLDSFDMAIAAASTEGAESSQSLKEGINMVLQQFRTVLKEAGMEEIEAQGKPFDPNLHEAVSELETDEVQEGHVAHQIRKGYRLRDRLVRPSSVIVAKKPSA
jgi:molecular chaperone GrpE